MAPWSDAHASGFQVGGLIRGIDHEMKDRAVVP